MSAQANYAFVHGGGQGGWVWDETIAALNRQSSENFGRVLTLDIPGCGSKRDRKTDGIDVSAMVAELIADVEAAGLKDIVLIGHSQAGTILPLLIEARPSLFRRVVYVSCLAPIGTQTALNWMAELPHEGSALFHSAEPGSRERYRAMFCNDMTLGETEAFLDKLGKDQWPSSSYRISGWRYDHLEALPASYVLCLRDTTLMPSWQEVFAERLRVKNIIRVDSGHQVMNTRPHALAEILRHEAMK